MNEHSPITVTVSGTTCVGKTAIVDAIKTALEAANLNVVIDEHLINELPLAKAKLMLQYANVLLTARRKSCSLNGTFVPNRKSQHRHGIHPFDNLIETVTSAPVSPNVRRTGLFRGGDARRSRQCGLCKVGHHSERIGSVKEIRAYLGAPPH